MSITSIEKNGHGYRVSHGKVDNVTGFNISRSGMMGLIEMLSVELKYGLENSTQEQRLGLRRQLRDLIGYEPDGRY